MDTYAPSLPSGSSSIEIAAVLSHRKDMTIEVAKDSWMRSLKFLANLRASKSIEFRFSRALCDLRLPKGLPMNEMASIGNREMNCVS